MELRSRAKGDDKYETLHGPHGAQREGEYDTLHPEAQGKEKKEGEYQGEGATGGAEGYEALKREGMKREVYHTLGMEDAGGGEGGYEAVGKGSEYEIVEEKK